VRARVTRLRALSSCNVGMSPQDKKVQGYSLTLVMGSMKCGNRFDNFFMGDNTDMSLMVTIYHPPSGQKLEVWSDQVGFQMFTGPGNGDYYQQGIALEASGAVDATNFPNFPSITPGTRFV